MLKDPFGSIQWIFCPRSGKFLWAQNGTLFCPQSGFTRNCDDYMHLKHATGADTQRFLRRNEYEILPFFMTQAEKDYDPAGMVKARPVIHETCPQCEHIGLRFHTMQLRSADEGQTVFFECVKCLFKWSTNN